MTRELFVNRKLLEDVLNHRKFRENLDEGIRIMKDRGREASFAVFYDFKREEISITDIIVGLSSGYTSNSPFYEPHQVPIIEAHTHGDHLKPSPVFFASEHEEHLNYEEFLNEHFELAARLEGVKSTSVEEEILKDTHWGVVGDLACLNNTIGMYSEKGSIVRPVEGIWCGKDYGQIDLAKEPSTNKPLVLVQQLEWKRTINLAQMLDEDVYGKGYESLYPSIPVDEFLRKLTKTYLYKAVQISIPPDYRQLTDSQASKLTRFKYTAKIATGI